MPTPQSSRNGQSSLWRYRELRSRRWSRIIALTLVLVAIFPPVRLRVKAAATMIESIGRRVPRPFAPETRAVTAAIGGVTGRLYLGQAGARGVLLVPGAAPAGIEDPRTNSVAAALVRAGRTVFIPQLDLYSEQFREVDIERLIASVLALSESTTHKVVVLGISYGGSLALIAAADPRLDGHLSRVGTFGAYFDLIGVIQAITTGASVVGDRTINWEAHPMAREFLYARTTQQLVPEAEQSLFLDALAGVADPSRLSLASNSYYHLLVNLDPHRTYELAEALDLHYRMFLQTFSPSTVAGEIDVPVRALHSTDDPIVPYAELERMGAAMPAVETTAVSIFQHVDFDPRSPSDWIGASPDLVRLWSFTTWLLAG